MRDESRLRIGELSRRSDVSPELLRAWERRYDLLHPTRSPGGLRLYSLEDPERVRLMSRHIADGLAAREAAALAVRAPLGAAPSAAAAAAAFDPAGARSEELLEPLLPELTGLARRRRVAIAGPGARGIDGGALLTLTGDPAAEAERVGAP